MDREKRRAPQKATAQRGARRAIHVGPERDADIVRAIESAGGEVVDEPSAASGAIILSSDQGYINQIVESEVEWIQMPWAGIDQWEFAGGPGIERQYTAAGPAYAPAVAEHAVATSLALLKQLHAASRASTWSRDLDLRQMRGTSVLLVGTGRIGSAIAQLLEPWGVTLFGMNRTGQSILEAKETYRLDEFPPDLPGVSLAICSLPHTPQTNKALGGAFFDTLDHGSYFVNVGRGAVVDTAALIEALDTGQLAGAALDVTEPEPLPDGHPLWDMRQVLITPHVANPPGIVAPGLADLIAENVARWVEGQPLVGVVDPDRGY